MTQTTLIAVNGTLMRGLVLNPNLIEVGATFVREDATAPCYRLWTVGDRHPAMIRTTDGSGTAVLVEVWEIPLEGLASVLAKEPAGLTIGKVLLADQSEMLGVVGEPFLVENELEITEFAGWRAYIASKTSEK